MTPLKPWKPWYRRLAVRISVRALLVLVLAIGGGLGWYVHRAKVQREAVEVILRAGGEIDYDGRYVDGEYLPGGGAWWPKRLVDRVGIDYLGKVTMVRVAIWDGERPGEETMAAVGRLDHLEYFLVPRTNVSSDAVWAHLRGNGRLKELRIPLMTGAGLVHLEGLTRLERLDLPTISATDADLAHLSGLVRLRELNMTFDEGSSIGDPGLAHLLPLRELKDLSLGAATKVTNEGLALLARLDKLERLYLHDSRVTDLKGLAPLVGLKALGLFGVPVDDARLAPLAGFRSLRDLNLSHNPSLTDAGLAHLRGLAGLESLDVRACKVTDAGLASLQGCRKLESINISETNVGDEGLVALAKLKGLRWIDAKWTRVTPEGFKAARAGLPGATIWH